MTTLPSPHKIQLTIQDSTGTDGKAREEEEVEEVTGLNTKRQTHQA